MIIDDKFTNILFCQLVDEGIVSAPVDDWIEGVNTKNKKDLGKLFEAILLNKKITSFSESEDIIESIKKATPSLIDFQDPNRNSIPLRKIDTPDRNEIFQTVSEVRFYKDFVTPFLYNTLKSVLLDQNSLWNKLLTRDGRHFDDGKLRRIINNIPELVIYYAAGMWEEIDKNSYPEEAIDIMEFSFIDETFIPAILITINEPKKLLLESNSLQEPILTTKIILPSSTALNYHSSSVQELKMMKVAFSNSGLFLPKIDNAEHLLNLLQDDRVISFQSMTNELFMRIRNGDVSGLTNLLKNYEDAKKGLNSISKKKQIVKWSFWGPVAAGVVETLLGALPIASMTAGLALQGYSNTLDKAEQKNKWAWLINEN